MRDEQGRGRIRMGEEAGMMHREERGEMVGGGKERMGLGYVGREEDNGNEGEKRKRRNND